MRTAIVVALLSVGRHNLNSCNTCHISLLASFVPTTTSRKRTQSLEFRPPCLRLHIPSAFLPACLSAEHPTLFCCPEPPYLWRLQHAITFGDLMSIVIHCSLVITPRLVSCTVDMMISSTSFLLNLSGHWVTGLCRSSIQRPPRRNPGGNMSCPLGTCLGMGGQACQKV